MEDGSYSPRPVDSVAKGLAKAYFDVSNIIMRTIPQATDLYLMYLNMASSLWPDMHIATLMRAEIYKKHEDMRTYFSLVNSIPKSSYLYPMAQMTYGSYLADRQSPKAPAIYKGLVSKYPGIPQLYQGLGDYYKREKKYKDALEYYSKGIEIGGASQTLSELHFSRGVVHDMLDNSKEAEKDLEAAVTLDHKNPVVLNYYGYYLTSRDIDAEKGFKLIERAIAADPLNPYYLDSYGWAFFKKGDIASAVQMLEYAKTLRPKNPVIADHLGDVYWSMGRRREAKFEWEKALGYIDFDAGILAHELDRSRLEYKIEYGMKE
jgi:tetratricopeptide (TPR) repeat protein